VWGYPADDRACRRPCRMSSPDANLECLQAYDLAIERREPDEELLLMMRGTVPTMRYEMG